MVWQEGAARTKTVGKFIILIGCTIAVLAWLSFFGAHGSFGLVELLVLLITPVAFGGLVYALGWILEGYHQPPAPTAWTNTRSTLATINRRLTL